MGVAGKCVCVSTICSTGVKYRYRRSRAIVQLNLMLSRRAHFEYFGFGENRWQVVQVELMFCSILFVWGFTSRGLDRLVRSDNFWEDGWKKCRWSFWVLMKCKVMCCSCRYGRDVLLFWWLVRCTGAFYFVLRFPCCLPLCFVGPRFPV